MLKIFSSSKLEQLHKASLTSDFAEGGDRITAILTALKQHPELQIDIGNRYPREELLKIIQLTHPEKYLSGFEASCERIIKGGESTIDVSCLEMPPKLIQEMQNHSGVSENYSEILLKRHFFEWNKNDTPITSSTFDAALISAGLGLEATDSVWRGIVDRAFALCRPPGHHALSTMPMGYCYLNNIAISANYLLSKGAKNILIVDFDVHHGNGTQDIFYESNHVTVVNLHHQVKDFYPRITGFENEIGSGVGEGFNYNVPLPHLCNEAEYLNALEKILNKLSQNQYDIILVSAGYDGHKADPKQAMLLDEKSFAEITSRLIQFAKSNSHNKIVFFLEGGYNRQATANSVLETAKVLKAA